MKFYAGLLVTACGLALAGVLGAQSLPQPRQAAAQPEQKAAPDPGPPVQPQPRKTAGPAAVFQPSEKIRADSAVSFPVDI